MSLLLATSVRSTYSKVNSFTISKLGNNLTLSFKRSISLKLSITDYEK